MAVKYTNRAKSKFAVTFNPGNTSLTVSPGDGNAKFPSLSADDWFPLVGVKADGTYEIMRCTARSGDILTVERAREGTSELSFVAGDIVDLRMTKSAFDAIQSPIHCTATGTNTIALSPSDLVIPEMMSGQEFVFVAAATNTGAVTANVSGIGAIAVQKDAGAALVAGDIVIGLTYRLHYNGTAFICTTINKVPNATTADNSSNLGGVAASDYVRKSTTNTITQPLTITGTAITMLAVGSSNAAGTTAIVTNSSTDVNAHGVVIAQGGVNAGAKFVGYSAGAYLGEWGFADNYDCYLNLSSGQVYTVTGAKVHTFIGDTYAQFLFRAVGGQTLGLYSGPGYSVVATVESSLTMKGGAAVNLFTTGASERQHLTVVSDGQHFSDAPNYPGVVYRKYDCRAWCTYTDTNDSAGSGGLLRAAGNVSSVTDEGNGSYVVNYTNIIPTPHGAVSGLASFTNSSPSIDNANEWGTNNRDVLTASVPYSSIWNCRLIFDSDADSQASPARFTFSVVC